MKLQAQSVAVVDDDVAVCDSVRVLLEADCFCVQTYLSGEDFLRENPDVTCVIIDYQMPGLNGLDCVSELRKRGSTMAAIMITGTNDPTVERRAAELRIKQVLNKPLDSRVLLCAIWQELE